MIITLSRQAATNGALVAQLVAERLGLRIFDRELIEVIAREVQIDPGVVRQFDEHAPTLVEAVLWEWRTSLSELAYGRLLREALQRIAAQDQVVIIGRGANYVLRCADCLRVRVVAPLALRVEMYRAGEGVSDKAARHWIAAEDRQREQFVKRVFGKRIEDAHGYDLVLNLEGLTPEMAAEVIAQAAQLRHAAHIPASAIATLPEYIRIMSRHRKPTTPPTIGEPQNRAA
jgi:hypothetical protein